YGRHVIEVPRQCVFIGSTNYDAYLKDETGERRSGPIKWGRIDLLAIERDRDQLWAEAVHMFEAEAPWWLGTAGDGRDGHEEQAARFVYDPWHDGIARFLMSRDDTAVSEILRDHLGLDEAKWTQGEENRVARVLKKLRWVRYKTGSEPRTWRYGRHRRPS